MIKDLKPILYAGALVGVLDITAACIQVYVAYGYAPARLLKGVAGGLLGRSAVEGGFSTAALGLLMHFTMAMTVAAIFYALSRRLTLPKNFPELLLWGCFMERRFLQSIISRQHHSYRGFAVFICIRRFHSSSRWAGRN